MWEASWRLCMACVLVTRSCERGKARAAHPSTHSLCRPQGTKPPVPGSLPCLALCRRSVGLSPHTGEFQLMVFQARRARRALRFGRHPPLRFVVLLLLAGAVLFPVLKGCSCFFRHPLPRFHGLFRACPTARALGGVVRVRVGAVPRTVCAAHLLVPVLVSGAETYRSGRALVYG